MHLVQSALMKHCLVALRLILLNTSRSRGQVRTVPAGEREPSNSEEKQGSSRIFNFEWEDSYAYIVKKEPCRKTEEELIHVNYNTY
jgi:hypothetical protein